MFDSAAALASLDGIAYDQKPYGIVKVDDDGKVIEYNRWEADMAGVDPNWAKGRNFFTEVAPCTNNRLVFGRFKQGVQSGALDMQCNYTFTYKMKPTNVKLGLFRDPASGSNFVLVSN